MTETEFRDILQEILVLDMGESPSQITTVISFADLQQLMSNTGLVIRTKDQSEFWITIQKTR